MSKIAEPLRCTECHSVINVKSTRDYGVQVIQNKSLIQNKLLHASILYETNSFSVT